MCRMTVGNSRRRSKPTRVWRRTVIVALTVTAGVVLFAILTGRLGGGPPADRPPAAVGPRTLEAGGVAVVQAPGWKPPARPLRVPGMPFDDHVALVELGSDLQLVAGTLAA